MSVSSIVISIILVAIAVAEVFVFQKNKKIKNDLVKREGEAKQKMYEMVILSELSDKMGYSLGAQNVIETVIKSLPEIIDYNTVSYMLLMPEKIIFRCYIKNPVSQNFINAVREKMLEYLSAALNADFKNIAVEETLWGTVLEAESDNQLKSFFNAPIIISNKIVGLMNVASERGGLYNEKEIAVVNGIVQQATEAVSKLQKVIES